MKKYGYLLALFLVGCGGTVPGQQVAADTIWHFYGMKGPEPDIFWRFSDSLDCHEPGAASNDGWKDPYAVDAPSGCVAGEIGLDSWVVEVSLPDGQPIHRSSLAHEYLHAKLWLQKGDADFKHESPLWHTLLPAVNTAIQREGL